MNILSLKPDLSERQKMLSNMLYKHADDQLTYDRQRAADLTYKFNNTSPKEQQKRNRIIDELIGAVGQDCEIKQPFLCDYGNNIKFGDRVFINYGCIILDCNEVVIGSDTLLAPGVQISTAYHPTDHQQRLNKDEAAAAIKIGSNVWIGAGAIICPGIEIGDNTTIGAGSIVTKDIPSNVVAVGNPCKVIKHLD